MNETQFAKNVKLRSGEMKIKNLRIIKKNNKF